MEVEEDMKEINGNVRKYNKNKLLKKINFSLNA